MSWLRWPPGPCGSSRREDLDGSGRRARDLCDRHEPVHAHGDVDGGARVIERVPDPGWGTNSSSPRGGEQGVVDDDGSCARA